jgi:hypothetical protein
LFTGKENGIIAGEMQRQQAVIFRNLQPECSAVERFRLFNVADRETAKRFTVF